nr:hypothetical protein [Deltaproteobacteria bacterium]
MRCQWTRRCGEAAACVVPPERCDGDDDDCDNAIDNGLTTLGRDLSLGQSWAPLEAAGLGDGDVGIVRQTSYGLAAFSFVRIRGENVVGTVPLYESPRRGASRTICALGSGRFDVVWGEHETTPGSSSAALWHSRVTPDDRASAPRRIYQTVGYFIVGTRVVCSEEGSRLVWLEYRDSGDDVGGVVRTAYLTSDSGPVLAATVEGIGVPVRDVALARIPGGYVLATTEFQAPYSRDRLTSVIHLRMYRDDGTLLRGPLPITPEGSVGHGVRVVWTGRRIVAAWQTTWPEPSPAPPTVRAFALDGTPLMAALEIPGAFGAVDLAMTAVDDGAVLLWHGIGDTSVGRYAHHYLRLRDYGVRVGPMTSALRRGDPSTLPTLGVARGRTGLTLVDVSYAFRSPMAEDFYRLLPMEGCR